MKWRLGRVFDRELDLLSYGFAAQQRRDSQGAVKPGGDTRGAHNPSIHHYASILGNCSEILEQMKGRPMRSRSYAAKEARRTAQ